MWRASNFWRWVMLTEASALGVSLLYMSLMVHTNPGQGLTGLAALADLSQALAAAMLAIATYLVAKWALMVTAPLWLLSELVAWRHRSWCRGLIEDAGRMGREGVKPSEPDKHGIVPQLFPRA